MRARRAVAWTVGSLAVAGAVLPWGVFVWSREVIGLLFFLVGFSLLGVALAALAWAFGTVPGVPGPRGPRGPAGAAVDVAPTPTRTGLPVVEPAADIAARESFPSYEDDPEAARRAMQERVDRSRPAPVSWADRG